MTDFEYFVPEWGFPYFSNSDISDIKEYEKNSRSFGTDRITFLLRCIINCHKKQDNL